MLPHSALSRPTAVVNGEAADEVWFLGSAHMEALYVYNYREKQRESNLYL